MVKYHTVSIPKEVANDIQKLINEIGYWPSISSFVREAAIEKLRKERQQLIPIVLDEDGERIEKV